MKTVSPQYTERRFGGIGIQYGITMAKTASDKWKKVFLIVMKIRNLVELFSMLPQNERIIVDVLRQIVLDTVPGVKEKISYNVPFFYRNKSICLIWPATIPRGGIKKGVLLGFWYGNRLNDEDNYLTHGTNKQIFYKIFYEPEEIDDAAIIKMLKEATTLDDGFGR